MRTIFLALAQASPSPTTSNLNSNGTDNNALLVAIIGAIGLIVAAAIPVLLNWTVQRKSTSKSEPTAGIGQKEKVQRLTLVTASSASHVPPTVDTQDAQHSHRGNLSGRNNILIGRDKEVKALKQLLQEPHVCLATLTGPAGVGKTRLALEVASQLMDNFADGSYCVSLATVESNLVMVAIAETLNIKENKDKPIFESVKEYLGERTMLLLLDSFEHVLGAAKLVAQLLNETKHVKVLVTSRVALQLSIEKTYPVSPLEVPNLKAPLPLEVISRYNSVKYFVARAKAVKPDFELNSLNAYAVASICARLDGLPLALELAAGHIRATSPQELLDNLGSRLDLLVDGPRDLPDRHQTLRGMIDWSYAVLSPSEQRVFRQLAVFRSGCTLEAARAVCAASKSKQSEVSGHITALVTHNLVNRTETQEGKSRYSLLETLHEYATQRLEESGEAYEAKQRHATFFLHFSEDAERKLVGKGQTECLMRFDEEHDNLRAAFEWALKERDAELVLKMAAALWRFWNMRAYLREWQQSISAALEISNHLKPSVALVKAQIGAAVLARRLSNKAESKRLYEESLTLSRNIGYKPGTTFSLIGLGDLARDNYDNEQARQLYEEGLTVAREVDDRIAISISLSNLGSLAQAAEDNVAASKLYEENLKIVSELEDQRGIAITLSKLGSIACEEQDYAKAKKLHSDSLRIKEDMGDKIGVAISKNQLGDIALRLHDLSEAEALFEESLKIASGIGDGPGTAIALQDLGYVAQKRSDPQEALSKFMESLTIMSDLRYQRGITGCLQGIAWAIGLCGRQEEAVRLLGATQSMRDKIKQALPNSQRPDYLDNMNRLRKGMSIDSWEQIWAEGYAMSVQEAVNYALEQGKVAAN